MPTQAQIKLRAAQVEAEREERRKRLEPAILGIVSALGGYEDVLVEDPTSGDETERTRTERVYKLGDESLGCLKDLKRCWRFDESDEYRTVARILHSCRVLPNDLLPIMLSLHPETNKKDHRVALLCASLIAALTWPIDIDAELKEAQGAEDEESRDRMNGMDYASLIDAQLSYKYSIIKSGAMVHIFKLVLPVIQKNRAERTSKDESIVSLVLHIIRNLLALRDKPLAGPSFGDLDASYLQSDLILQLSEFGMLDLLIHMSYGASRFDLFGQWNFLVLEIWYLLFRGTDAEALIGAQPNHGILPATASDRKLESLLNIEDRERKAKARKGVSRHSRFGTTLTVQTGDRKYNFHNQSAITAPVEVALDSRKHQKSQRARLKDDVGRATALRPVSIKVLRKVAIEFVESGFNPFFLSVLKDIRMERQEADPAATIRLLFLLAFFLKAFLRIRQVENLLVISPTSEEGHDFDLIAELLEPECIHWTASKIQNGLQESPMPSVEIQVAVKCLTQQLLAIEALSASGVDQYVEVADVIQYKLFYDGDALDMVITLASKYNHQSWSYLDSIVHFSFVFLRMLERYAKSTEHMFVRTRRKGKSRVKGNDKNKMEGVSTRVESENEEVNAVEETENQFKYAEREFQFARLESRFAHESVVNTLIRYICGYEHFDDPELMRRAVKLMHRQAVNAKAEGLFFRVSILNTFHTFIRSRNAMPKHPAYDDLFRFIDYILKQFFKCVREKPFFLVEVLFNKGTKEGLRAFKKGEASDDNSDAQEGGESSGNKTSKKKDLKLPVEIEIKPGLTWSMRLGVAVGLLAENHKSHLINKVVDDLRLVVAGRVEIIQSTAQANGTEYDADQSPNLHDWLGFSKETPDETLMAQIIQPPWEALEKFEDYQITVSGDDEYQEALQRDPQLHTLLRELQWESREEPPGHLCWQVPKNRVPGELEVEIKTINYFLANPLDHDGKSAAQLTRRKRKTKRRTRRDPSISSNRDLEATAKAKQTRQEKKQQETNKYLSAQFITESDDEDNEERDRLFFEKERQLRLEVSARALAAHQPQGPSDTSVALPQVDLPRHKIRPVRTGKRRPSSPSRNNDGSMMDLDPPAELALETEENAPHSSPSGSSMGAGDKARGGTTTPTRSTSPSSALSSGPKVLSSMGGQKRDISSISNEFDTNDHESDQEPLRSNRQVKNRRLFLESDEE